MLTKCPDCGGELEKGALLDYSYARGFIQRYGKTDYTDHKVSLNNPSLGMEEDVRDVRRTKSLRCLKCNRIFIYAQDIIQIEKMNKSKINLLMIVILSVLVVIFGLILGFLKI